jgi:hypothetical protein
MSTVKRSPGDSAASWSRPTDLEEQQLLGQREVFLQVAIARERRGGIRQQRFVLGDPTGAIERMRNGVSLAVGAAVPATSALPRRGGAGAEALSSPRRRRHARNSRSLPRRRVSGFT